MSNQVIKMLNENTAINGSNDTLSPSVLETQLKVSGKGDRDTNDQKLTLPAAEQLTSEIKKLLRGNEKIGDRIIEKFAKLKRGNGLAAMGFNKPNPWPEYLKAYFLNDYKEQPRYLRHLVNVATFLADTDLGFSADEIAIARLVCKKSRKKWGDIWAAAIKLSGGVTPDKASVAKAIAGLQEHSSDQDTETKSVNGFTGNEVSESKGFNEIESADQGSDDDTESEETSPRGDPNMQSDETDHKKPQIDSNPLPIKGNSHLTNAGTSFYKNHVFSRSESEVEDIKEKLKARIQQLQDTADPIETLGLADISSVLEMIEINCS